MAICKLEKPMSASPKLIVVDAILKRQPGYMDAFESLLDTVAHTRRECRSIYIRWKGICCISKPSDGRPVRRLYVEMLDVRL